MINNFCCKELTAIGASYNGKKINFVDPFSVCHFSLVLANREKMANDPK